MKSRWADRITDKPVLDNDAFNRRLPNRLLTVRAFAEAAALGVPTVRRWIARRQIASVRVGTRAIRIPEAELLRLINDGLVAASDNS